MRKATKQRDGASDPAGISRAKPAKGGSGHPDDSPKQAVESGDSGLTGRGADRRAVGEDKSARGKDDVRSAPESGS